MPSHPIFLLAVLGLAIAASEWLASRTALRHLGSALLVIVLTAILANLRIIPAYSDEVGIYHGVFAYVAPISIVLLLLRVNLREVAKAGPRMLLLFALGSLGTMVGVVAGMAVIGGSQAFGELHFALGGMFVGTYTGGSVNFNAIALEYGVNRVGELYAGAAAVDSAMTTVWMAATVALPRWLAGSSRSKVAPETASSELELEDRETVVPLDMGVLIGLAAGIAWFSEWATDQLAASAGVDIPSILLLTTLALIAAQFPAIQRLQGAKVLGWVAVLFFLSVIGALCDLHALSRMGQLGLQLSGFVVVVVLVHGLITFGGGQFLRADPAMTAVASQANIGGGTSALALARSLGRGDLMLPAILIGAVGNAVGTYLGFLTATLLK